jgi:four helix bundle protein
VTLQEWELEVPDVIRADTVWSVEAYRLGLFLSDLAWQDGRKLLSDRRSRSIADQLCRSVGSISSNIAEGYSRNTGRERSRFYEFALGSARESRDWYFKSRHILPIKVVSHRLAIATSIIRLTLKMTSTERRSNRKIIPQ